MTFRTFAVSDPAHEEGGVRQISVKSAALKRRADITLCAPPGEGPIPLVILLHGVYGSHWQWCGLGGAHRTLARLVGKKIRNVALAMPSDGLFGDGSAYALAGGEDAETWIVNEVPAAVALADPRVVPEGPLALVGLSMGGFGALRLAAMHPERVSAAAGMSSMTNIEQMALLVEEPPESYTVAAGTGSLLEALSGAATCPPIRFDCGTDDPFLTANRELHAGLDAAGVSHVYEEFDGAHDWTYWTAHLEDALGFIDSMWSRPG